MNERWRYNIENITTWLAIKTVRVSPVLRQAMPLSTDLGCQR